MKVFAIAFFVLMMVASTVTAVEPRMCESKSINFKGLCISDTNCGNICKGEGFNGGKCKGEVLIPGMCFCTIPCPTGVSAKGRDSAPVDASNSAPNATKGGDSAPADDSDPAADPAKGGNSAPADAPDSAPDATKGGDSAPTDASNSAPDAPKGGDSAPADASNSAPNAPKGGDSAGRQCESKSNSFWGPCFSDTNCGNVCKGEEFSGGHCKGFRQRCFCTKNC